MSDEKKPPLQEFADHQVSALEEAGKALVSLIPTGVRTHGWNAIEETGKGVGVLVNAAADGIKSVLQAPDKDK